MVGKGTVRGTYSMGSGKKEKSEPAENVAISRDGHKEQPENGRATGNPQRKKPNHNNKKRIGGGG